ncbi:hypothetical protein [Dankookia sp. P2]|uniref:hypothetical protein n=1 Tax=Dankookia sp. P2 TaxID=3423955 RepID=UPI003D6747D3
MAIRTAIISVAEARMTPCSDGSARPQADDAAKAPTASKPSGKRSYRQDHDSNLAGAAMSAIQDLVLVLGIIVGNLGFISSIALIIGWYAP